MESGNQPVEGQIGVGNVILNRAGDPRFGETIKDVIFQPGQFTPASTGRSVRRALCDKRYLRKACIRRL